MGVLHIDISRAYVRAPINEAKYIEILPEDIGSPGEEWNMCARLNISLYGTRDAASNWEEAYASVFTSHCSKKGSASPCVCFNRERAVRVVVHGDDSSKVLDLFLICSGFRKYYLLILYVSIESWDRH